MYNLIGYVSGNLTVVEKLVAKDHAGKTQWRCLCKCGKSRVCITYELTSNLNALQSCRMCNWHITHKDAYISWCSARQRVYNTTSKDYATYGKLGITMSSRWDKFTNFLDDMGDPPKDSITGERLSLDRIDNKGNYELGNCRWATRSQQQLNKGKVEANERQAVSNNQ